MEHTTATKECFFRRLDEGETVSSFDCGEKYADLNDFIKNDAPKYRKELLAVSYVIEDEKQVMAYFSLANDRIGIEDFPSSTDFNRFRRKRFINAKRIKHYPAVKICRLGISIERQLCGLGTRIINLIKMFFIKDNKTGCRYITVDAHRDAIPFYQKNGFTLLTDEDENDITRLMYFDLMKLDLPI